MKVRVFIERSNDGYSAYMPDDNNLPFGLTGDGKTAQEAMQDFLLARDEMKEFFIEEGKEEDAYLLYKNASFDLKKYTDAL